MSLTVIVPTHRRPAGLARVLAGLCRQGDPGVPWDVVVIDNDDAATSQAAPVVAEYEALLPVPLRCVREPVLGASAARNRGVEEATGAVIAMLDDDVVPAPDWLACLVAPILAGRCDAAGGRVVLDPETPRPKWLVPRIARYLAEFDPGGAESDVRDLPIDVVPEPYVITANAAFDAARLRAIGGFDPALGPRAGIPLVNDDVSLCRRYLAAGGSIRFVPSALVVHELPPQRLNRRYVLRRFYGQGRSDWLLDRARHETRRLGGVRGAATGAFHGWRAGLQGRLPERPWLWLACDAAHRAGFIREALSNAVRGSGAGT